MNSIANLITRTPGSSAVNSSVRAASLGSSLGNGFGYVRLEDFGGESNDWDDAIIRGGVPGRSGINQSTQTRSDERISKGGSLPLPSDINDSASSGKASSYSGPIIGGNLKAISGIASAGISSALRAGDQFRANSTLNSNLQQHGVGLTSAITAIQQNQQVAADYGSAGAALGSVLGPLGSIGGYFLGHTFAPQSSIPGISSSSGMISADSPGVAFGHTTAAAGDAKSLDYGGF